MLSTGPVPEQAAPQEKSSYTDEDIRMSPKFRVTRPDGSYYVLARDSVTSVVSTTNASWCELTVTGGPPPAKLLVVGDETVLKAFFPRANKAVSSVKPKKALDLPEASEGVIGAQDEVLTAQLI